MWRLPRHRPHPHSHQLHQHHHHHHSHTAHQLTTPSLVPHGMLVAKCMSMCVMTLSIFPHTAVGTIPRAETWRASFVNVEPHCGKATQTIRKIHVRAKHGLGWLLGQSRKSSTTWHSETQIPSIVVGATPPAHLTGTLPSPVFSTVCNVCAGWCFSS